MGRRIPIDYIPEGSRLIFVRRTVISDFHNKIRGKALYRCICGGEIETDPSRVKNGTTISCGCYHKERTRESNTRHGLKGHPLYIVWKSMKSRCLNKNNPAYKDYGARGITICDEWKNDFAAFLQWAFSNGWKKGYEIDKDIIPKRLGIAPKEYSPSYCTIATVTENSNARINFNHPLELRGVSKNIAEWSRELGISTQVIQTRLKLGWRVERILTTPVNRNRRKKLTVQKKDRLILMHKQGLSQTKIAKVLNLNPSTVNRFINRKLQ